MKKKTAQSQLNFLKKEKDYTNSTPGNNCASALNQSVVDSRLLGRCERGLLITINSSEKPTSVQGPFPPKKNALGFRGKQNGSGHLFDFTSEFA